MVLLAVFGSLRFGELLGLRREDVDLDRSVVHVRRSLSEVNGAFVIKAPKTSAGVRTVALPRWVGTELAIHLSTFAEHGIGGRLFIGPKG